jgi:hypothetical protein
MAGLRTLQVQPYSPDFPERCRSSVIVAFVPAYRCGAVPDFHRIPFSFSLRRNLGMDPQYLVLKGNASPLLVDISQCYRFPCNL